MALRLSRTLQHHARPYSSSTRLIHIRAASRPALRRAWPALAVPVPPSSMSRRTYATKDEPHPKGKYPPDGKAHGSVREVMDSAASEIRGAKETLADSIAGGHAARSRGGLSDEIDQMAFPIALAEHVPRVAWLFGAAGVVPYLATSMTTVYLARQASLAKEGNFAQSIDFDTADALLYQTQQVQLTYGAVILSFLGAIHWGFEFARYGHKVGAPRLILGILPLALAWPSLLLPASQGLVVQLGAFFLAWYSDNRATSWGWTPRWYSTYRFALTAAVGVTIVISLTGSSYFDPKLKVPGIGENMIKEHAAQRTLFREHHDNSKSGQIESDVTLESAGDDSDHYLQFRDYKKEAEEREAKEREEQEEREAAENKEREEAEAHAQEKKTVAVKG